MINIIFDQIVQVTEKQNDQANKLIEQFVNRQETDYYQQKRNANNKDKIKKDIFRGKKAEWFSLILLCKKYNFPKIKIDMEIRNGYNKGWQVDLEFKSTNPQYPNVHVKSCDYYTTTRFGCSWCFQYKNNYGTGGKDPIFEHGDNDLVSLVYLDNEYTNTATVKAIIPWTIAKNYLDDPIKQEHKGKKKFIYYEDLIRKNNE